MATRGRRSDGERTRTEILDACVRLIARGGLVAATQRKVAAEAGVSLAAITYHFPAASALTDAALGHAVELYVRRLHTLKGEVLEGRRGLVEACVASTRDDEGGALDIAVAAYELVIGAVRDPGLRTRAEGLVDSLSDFFAPWSSRPELTLGTLSALLGLNLIGLATDGAAARRTEEQVTVILDLLGVSAKVDVTVPDR